MPVLVPERPTASRSALRYRPIEADRVPSVSSVVRARRPRPDARETTAPVVADERDLEEETRVSPQGPKAPTPRRNVVPAHSRPRMRPLVLMTLGLVLALLLWVVAQQAIRWATNEYNNVVYGSPRTFQVDQVVGQGDSPRHPSHFVVINLHGEVTLLDFAAGDPSRVRVLATLSIQGVDADQVVVTVRFIDLSQNGKPDLVIDMGGEKTVLINDGSTFRPPTLSEQQQILQWLQQHPS